MRIILLIGTIFITLSGAARQNRYKRPDPVATASEVNITRRDTIVEPQITLAGYDKPVDASRETIIATNNTDSNIIAITLTIKYIDHGGNLIHTATVDIPTYISPGESALLTWPSWDKNRTYYYAHGRVPSVRRLAHPYTIQARAIKAVTDNNQSNN